MKIKEVIVVEGRDDTTAVTRAVECDTVETHGFGIKKETWELIKKAYEERGIIIFTDPDHSGEEIRKKLSERFPNAKHAYLTKKEALGGNDVGIENASDKAICEALNKAKAKLVESTDIFTQRDMVDAGLAGGAGSKEKRQALGKALGIGYGNSLGFLKKLNAFGVTKEDFARELDKIERTLK